jgi:hypothetical protein
MHVELRRTVGRRREVSRLWFFKWGFGFWLGRIIFSIGHDTRPGAYAVASQAKR